MKSLALRGKWVLVTGASSGLGEAMAGVLARDHHANLIVVARRKDRLEELKRELEGSTGVQVETCVADLAQLGDVDRVLEEATRGRQLAAAVLNAGVTHFGHYDELGWDAFEAMLNTNVRAVVRMTTELVPHLEKAEGGGGLMIVSSLSGIHPVAYQTAYSATKAFLIAFGTGMWHELHGRNVSLTTYAPPGIVTEMTAGKRFEPLRGWLIRLDKAAEAGVTALVERKYLYVPGVRDRWGSAFLRALPHGFVTGRLAAVYRDALEKTKS
jgi:short-subunit dehydrogenase